jgi:hypothetical protein
MGSVLAIEQCSPHRYSEDSTRIPLPGDSQHKPTEAGGNRVSADERFTDTSTPGIQNLHPEHVAATVKVIEFRHHQRIPSAAGLVLWFPPADSDGRQPQCENTPQYQQLLCDKHQRTQVVFTLNTLKSRAESNSFIVQYPNSSCRHKFNKIHGDVELYVAPCVFVNNTYFYKNVCIITERDSAEDGLQLRSSTRSQAQEQPRFIDTICQFFEEEEEEAGNVSNENGRQQLDKNKSEPISGRILRTTILTDSGNRITIQSGRLFPLPLERQTRREDDGAPAREKAVAVNAVVGAATAFQTGTSS